MKKSFPFETTSMSLRVMAMVFMLCDHLWATIVPGNDWLTCIGRLTYPIFAFLLVEGYFHTRNFKKYMQRMLIFAVLSEIPFNLVCSSSLIYPIHQNVLWTFLISLLMIHMNERAKESGELWRRLVTAPLSVALGGLLGLITFCDYNHAGVFMVLTFYFFRGRNWWNYLLQLLAMYYINVEILAGISYQIQLFGDTVFFPRQALALLALIPIWLYRGKQGPHNKALQYMYYAFYPAHLLILGLLKAL